MIKISPSLLAADVSCLGKEIKTIDTADMLHVDVMDGHFVPNISFGVPVVAGIDKVSDIVQDVHLMITNPLKYIEAFAKAGADIITVHIEADDDVAECIKLIKSLGKKCGIALNPNTDPNLVKPYIKDVDMVLQMTVYPGFGGQSMERCALKNIEEIRKMAGPDLDIEVDGGIKAENCAELAKLGANVIVSGTGIFGKQDRKGAIEAIRKNCEQARGN